VSEEREVELEAEAEALGWEKQLKRWDMLFLVWWWFRC
jgi:hypothetical protein